MSVGPDSHPPQSGAVTISEIAAKRIAFLMGEEADPEAKLRVSVSGGGCSGFQYGFEFDRTINDDDQVIERDGAVVVIDETSLNYLAGSQIDFVDDLVGAAFAITNPNATSSCGCGNSFSLF
jgi:iron-sulfur cluster insertion protein